MNADASLKRKVLAELDWDPEVQAPGIAVSVQEGVVTVAGDVRTFAEKEAVAAAVRRVAGVHAVAMELEVTLAIPHRRSDAEIAASAAQALGWNTLIPADAIRLTVERGCITLRGEVPWEFQRRAAVHAVAGLMGVVDLRDEVTLCPRSRVASLAQRIEDALTRQATRESSRIHVCVDGKTVKLSGLVNCWRDREVAEAAAWSAPGVEQVVSELLSV